MWVLGLELRSSQGAECALSAELSPQAVPDPQMFLLLPAFFSLSVMWLHFSQHICRAQLWFFSPNLSHSSGGTRAHLPFPLEQAHILGLYSVSLWLCGLSSFPLYVENNLNIQRAIILFRFSPQACHAISPSLLTERGDSLVPEVDIQTELEFFPLQTSTSQGESHNPK